MVILEIHPILNAAEITAAIVFPFQDGDESLSSEARHTEASHTSVLVFCRNPVKSRLDERASDERKI